MDGWSATRNSNISISDYRFNPDRVIDKAIYEHPLQCSEGIQFVLVNGMLILTDGKIVEGISLGRSFEPP